MEIAREREGRYDGSLLTVAVLLLLAGTAVVLDASFARALQSLDSHKDAFFYFKRQLGWVLLALCVMAAVMKFPYWRLREGRFCFVGILIALVLLVLVLVPHVGIKVSGARRWLGYSVFRFQPSEFAKIALVVFLARFSELWRGRVQDFWRGFVPPVLAVLLIGGLVAKEDLGTGIIIITTGLAMVYMMGAKKRHLAGLVLLALAAAALFVLKDPMRLERVKAWLDLVFNPLAFHRGRAYQPSQGLIALGAGGVWGQGIMHGAAKHLYLPAEHTDYILATWGEETGLAGCLALLALFAWLIIRGLTISHRTRDWFGSLLAAGLTAMIGIQALLNVAVVTSIVPCTGVPLPFISYGGSSVVFTALAVGIILNVSQYPERPGTQGTPGGGQARRVRESRADGWRHRRPHLSRT